ncbi:flagellar hook-basal body protein [Bacillus sp. HMF5848]|uniref:flagellar hook-basal body protein n=1 Tax=Bacillus sp. HMF5848 TaxID=2495421 RepID=UPI000F7B2869|nr:flagellar hook-basal body protein [Bacillus sp. HMF5848]RSK28893.1 flagellar hook-basal body protein [Bacillus sp. HMF5848]
MLRGFYTAASGMLAQQRRTEMLTNNLANANTPGFKADQSAVRAFPEMLMQRMQADMTPTKDGQTARRMIPIGPMNTGVYLQETIPSFNQGDIRSTERSTDLAIINGTIPTNPETNVQGTLLFAVQGSDGATRYTRNGNFTIDSQGYLTTNDGYYVLDDTNNLIQPNSNDFTVDNSGTISTMNGPLATLNMVYAENPMNLVKEGNGLFRSEQDLPAAINNPDVSFKIQQGALEQSNVDTGQTMTNLMTAYRTFEANQKVIQAYDRSLEKAVNDIGRV